MWFNHIQKSNYVSTNVVVMCVPNNNEFKFNSKNKDSVIEEGNVVATEKMVKLSSNE